MISRVSLNERVQEWGLREDVVEKDYVLGWILWGIGSESARSPAPASGRLTSLSLTLDKWCHKVVP